MLLNSLKGEVVYVVIDDEGKFEGVYATQADAEEAKDHCDGEVHCTTVQGH